MNTHDCPTSRRAACRVRFAAGTQRRAGLSLAEMLIAIVILGLGLIMVATLFPVSWTRARELAEYTVQSNVTNQAAMLVRATGRVDILRSALTNEEVDTPGFAGDQIHVRYGDPPSFTADLPPDPLVHVLNLQNITAENRRFVAEDPHELDPREPVGIVAPNAVDDFQKKFDVSYFRPLLSFHQRVYPPMRARLDELDLQTPGVDDVWDAQLESRRYVFAVLHRLNDDYFNEVYADYLQNGNRIGNLMGLTRDFTMYYVTLRRPRATQRFARQDPDFTPDRSMPDTAVRPMPLPADQDVMFPVAWRVQIALPDPKTALKPTLEATGIPTELAVNIDPFSGYNSALWPDDLAVVEMFRRGAAFIDERSGQVYRVEKRRLAGDDDERAWITVDREIVIEDVDDGPGGFFRNGTIDPESEVLRIVWVYPPSVKRRTSIRAPLEFDGAQPVVGIDVRSLTVPPTR